MCVRSLGQEDLLEEGTATHYSILSWRIPGTEEPGGCSPQGHTELDMTEVTQHTSKQYGTGTKTEIKINGTRQKAQR